MEFTMHRPITKDYSCISNLWVINEIKNSKEKYKHCQIPIVNDMMPFSQENVSLIKGIL